MNGLFLNFRHALRQLRKNLGFAAIAILTLALGVGTSTAMFGVLNAVLLRPIPFPHPDRLVRIFSTHAGQILGPSTPDLRDYAAQNRTQVRGAPAAAVANVISQVKTVDAHMPMDFVEALENRVRDTAATQIALAKLSTFFGSLALLLASIGLYGVISYSVAGRTREIGVRMALGARRTDVVELVLLEAMLLVIVGIVVGIPLSRASSQLLHSFLFGLKAPDPLSLIAVVLLLGAVAAMAGMIPPRRAAKVEPRVALR
jgi:ABC-type antimicrobial peptide transport system permease subunit